MNRAPPPLGVALANCKAFLPAERCDYPSPTSQHVVEPGGRNCDFKPSEIPIWWRKHADEISSTCREFQGESPCKLLRTSVDFEAACSHTPGSSQPLKY